MVTGKIKEVIVREKDLVISYTNDEYPLGSGYQLLIQKHELLGFPFVGESIQVETDSTNEVITVTIEEKVILNRS